MKKNKSTKYYYLFFLLFFLVFAILYRPETPKLLEKSRFQFFTSIKTISKIDFVLTNNEKPLQTWTGPFTSYKQIDYLGDTNFADCEKLKLKLMNCKAGDTIKFLAVNFWKNNQLYSLSNTSFHKLTTSANLQILNDDKQLKIIVLRDNPETWLKFNDVNNWLTDNINSFKRMVLSAIFIIFLLLLIIIKPSRKWFFTSITVALCSMLFYWWVGLDVAVQLNIDQFSKSKMGVFYYNNVPLFGENFKTIYNDTLPLRKMQANTTNQLFYRIDFPDDKDKITETKIIYNSGLINKTWKLNSVEPYKLGGNDIDFRNNNYVLKGDDPYITITSADFICGIKKVLFLRSIIYLLLALSTFIILLLCEKWFVNYSAASLLPFLFFYTIIMCSFWFSLFNAQRLVLDDEKRLASPFPEKSKMGYKDYAQGISAYLKDQYPGKSRLTTLNNLIRFNAFGDIANNNIVHFGKKGWMFYIGENVKEVYENKNLYTIEQLQRMKAVLEERNDYLESMGIKYYILFPRMSHYFYQENVGATLHNFNKKAKLEQFLEYMKKNSKMNIIDIYTPMKIAKDTSKRDLYYHEDSHWNYFGAYFAYAQTINTIRKDFPNIPAPIPMKEIKWVETENEEGDLPQLLSLSKFIKRHEYIPMNDRVNCAYMIPPPEYPEYQSVHKMVFFQGKDNTLPKLIMNRDSYSNYLISYFGSHFSRQGYLWSPIFFPGIMKTEKPDIVITEMMERFLSDLLVPNPAIPKPEKATETDKK